MVEILPFRGLLYAADYFGPEVVAPPFDVIDEAERQRLLQRSPYNVVRIDKRPQGSDEGWYQEAAKLKRAWEEQGILMRDETPAFYGYRQVFIIEGEEYERIGFMAAVGLRPWGQGIFPHERTRLGDRVDRLLHMRAVQANMSPVFGLYRDPENATTALILQGAEAAREFELDGVRHSFWTIRDPQAVASLQRFMAEQEIVIADGHHRYETALAYQAEQRAAHSDPPTRQPYDYVMMYLTNADSPALVMWPTHRLIHGVAEVDQETLLHALHPYFEMWPLWDRVNWLERLMDVAQGSVTFGMILPDMGAFVLRLREGAAAPLLEGIPPALVSLDVTVLERVIFEPILGISTEHLEKTEHVSYTTNAHAAFEAVETGKAQIGFLLRPTTIDQVWNVAKQGLTMPQKSTYFYPKLLTGLVFYPLGTF